jgi:oxygen-dependent protoporphyrinogen oxidase
MNARKSVTIIGGGITGLTAAYELRDADIDVTLHEASGRLGGKVQTDHSLGAPVEAGADWFITRQPAALELCRELGLEHQLVTPDRSGAYVWSRGHLRRIIPELVRGVPTRPYKAMRAGLLSPIGAARATFELANRRRLSGPDRSVGAFVRKRFGSEVLERLVDPMLAASRSGSAHEMSLAAAAPELDAAARSHPSVTRALRHAQAGASATTPFLGLRGGMTSLIDGLAASLSADVSVRSPIAGMSRTNGGFTFSTKDGSRATNAVVVAVPAPAAAALVASLDEQLADDLRAIPYEPAIVASLAFARDAVRVPGEGSGVLIPSAEGRLLTAFAWFSEKWAHARPPDGSVVVRCFVGSRDALAWSDDQLVARICDDLRAITEAAADPTAYSVTRWDAALPVYRVGHRDLMQRIDAHLARLPGIELAGAGYRGSGLPDCISDGRRAARSVLAHLAANNS